jgi:FkbM family methyltransferase
MPSDLPWTDPHYRERLICRLRPDVLLDIGANEGQFARSCRNIGFGGRIISFEPQLDAFTSLKGYAASDSNWSCLNIALGRERGTASMHISGSSPSSSLLPIGKVHTQLMPISAEIGQSTVTVERLDNLVADLGLFGKSIFMKLDVQGYEGPVLEGANDVASRSLGVVAELNFAPLFDGQSKWHDVVCLLESLGFMFCGLTDQVWDRKNGAVLWADGVFLRNQTY